VNGKEFAAHIGVPHGTVKRWLHEGLPAVRRGGRAERCRLTLTIDVEAALAWISERYPKTLSFNRRSVVYVARRSTDGAVKIGFTSDIERRVRELRKENRTAVDLIALLPGAKPDELRLHARFAEKRLDGEWFAAEADEVVAELRKGAA
jgi:hypothetical protein